MRTPILVLVCIASLAVVQLAAAQSSIDIRKQGEGPDVREFAEGTNVPFLIVVTNTGLVDLIDVEVSDELTSDCNEFIGDLAAGIGHAYTCMAPNVTIGFDNRACVVATDPNGECFCPRTPGYWKNHLEAWPVTALVLGGVEYDTDQLLAFLRHKEMNEYASLKLARHLTAVLLNLASGSDLAIQPVVDQANAFLAIHPPGSEPQGADKALALAIKDQLDAYNNEVDCDDTETVECLTDCDTSEVVIGIVR